jgi:hypothetical protein
VTICREQKRFSIDIYRKLTATDVIIPNDSCHHRKHKMAAIRYMHNRMISYRLTPKNVQKGDTTMQILKTNKYNKSALGAINIERKHKCREEKTKCVKLTYVMLMVTYLDIWHSIMGNGVPVKHRDIAKSTK